MSAYALLLGLVASDPVALIETASRWLSVVEPAVADDRARLRMAREESAQIDRKAGALATDGQQCSIVGAGLCVRKRRPMLSAAID